MEKGTFSDPAVGSFLTDHYRGTQFDLASPHPDFAEATRTAKVIWAPTVIVDDLRGRELRRFTGWLPAEEWIAELRIPLGLDHLHHKRFDEAISTFGGIVEESPAVPAAPEALHLLGIAEFIAGKRDGGKLRARWNEVRERYPDSRFARHSEVIDDLPAT